MMNPLKTKGKRGPESYIQDAIVKMLRVKGWFVKETHGNMFQAGFPDVYATHSRYGPRWIEVKNPEHYAFTTAQMQDFPLFSAHGTRIWVLVAATESEYAKLFGPANWHTYLLNMKGSGR